MLIDFYTHRWRSKCFHVKKITLIFFLYDVISKKSISLSIYVSRFFYCKYFCTRIKKGRLKKEKKERLHDKRTLKNY